MNFPFAANTSSKEKTQEKQKYFRIPVCVLHKCTKLFTAWTQQKETAMDKPAAFILFSEVLLAICHLAISDFFCYTAGLVRHVKYIFL